MADGRKNNGGNSTKAKGVDRRKNEYKTALSEASTVEEVKEVINKLKKMAKGEDLQAIKLFLAYYLGNPKDTLESINYNIDDEELTDELIKQKLKQIKDNY